VDLVKRTPNPTRAMWMLNEVCSQLAMMHQAGFVHRDIKPANILWLQVWLPPLLPALVSLSAR
jgi:tRNA A-37 threonylcarbamoyl transferase component Bud32